TAGAGRGQSLAAPAGRSGHGLLEFIQEGDEAGLEVLGVGGEALLEVLHQGGHLLAQVAEVLHHLGLVLGGLG
ncbi:hypothetical protein BV219_15475, partial [Lactiplantibacillus plantarum]